MAKKITEYTSASQLEKYRFCPLAYKYVYVDGAKRVDNIYAMYGTSVHAALAHNFQQKITSKQDLSENKVADFFIDHFNSSITRVYGMANMSSTFLSRIEKLRQDGIWSLKQFMRYQAQYIQPIAVEIETVLTLSKYPFKVKVIIDLIEEEGTITDFKTAGLDYLKEYTKDKLAHSFQMKMYAMAYRKMYQKKEKRVRFLVLPRNQKACMTVESEYSDLEIAQFLGVCAQIETAIQKDVFIPNQSNCGKCDFKMNCAYSRYMEINTI